MQVCQTELDLGVLVEDNLKVTKQCTRAINTANKVLGLICRTFSCKSVDIILKLYKSLVRPHLDYCSQAWRPHLVKDIEALEKVQRRATRLMEGLKGLPYETRLRRTGLTDLETRRLRGDLIEVFKLLKGIDNVDYSNMFTFNSNALRGHHFKLFKPRARTNIGKYSFAHRIVDAWNALPEYVVSCSTVNSFRASLARYFRNCRGLI